MHFFKGISNNGIIVIKTAFSDFIFLLSFYLINEEAGYSALDKKRIRNENHSQ